MNPYNNILQREAMRRQVADLSHPTASHQDVGMIEAFLCILAALGSYVTEHDSRLARAVADSGTSEGRAKHDLLGNYAAHGNRHLAQLIDADCNRFNARLIANSQHAMSSTGRCDIVQNIADMLDATDEVLKPFITDISDYFWRHIPKTGPLHPLDSWLLHDMMLTHVLTSTMVQVYDKAVQILPSLADNADKVGYFNLRPTMQRINTLADRMPWLNDKRQPLHYNFDAVTSTDELLTICAQLRDAIFSTKFLDLMFYVREGVDNQFRYKCAALLTGVPYSRRLDISKYLTSDINLLKFTNND